MTWALYCFSTFFWSVYTLAAHFGWGSIPAVNSEWLWNELVWSESDCVLAALTQRACPWCFNKFWCPNQSAEKCGSWYLVQPWRKREVWGRKRRGDWPLPPCHENQMFSWTPRHPICTNTQRTPNHSLCIRYSWTKQLNQLDLTVNLHRWYTYVPNHGNPSTVACVLCGCTYVRHWWR